MSSESLTKIVRDLIKLAQMKKSQLRSCWGKYF
jgi:hypothetical protein